MSSWFGGGAGTSQQEQAAMEMLQRKQVPPHTNTAPPIPPFTSLEVMWLLALTLGPTRIERKHTRPVCHRHQAGGR